jgi:hypothetical protein
MIIYRIPAMAIAIRVMKEAQADPSNPSAGKPRWPQINR